MEEIPGMPTITGWFIIISALVWLAWEIWAIVTKREVISVAVYRFAKANPAVPFSIGFLMGHFFW